MQALLGLGTATAMPGYGLDAAGSADFAEGTAVIRAAVEGGVRYIDTAAAYAEAEKWIGAAHDLIGKNGVRISTKLTLTQLETGEMSRSLRRLALPRADTVLLTGIYDREGHPRSGQSSLPDPRIGEYFSMVKQQGMAQHTGVSTYGLDDARLALEQSWCDVVQVEYSILNPSIVPALRRFNASHKEIVVRSVLCNGLLTDRRHRVKDFDEGTTATLDRLEETARSWGYDLPQLAIRFALDTPGVDVALVGVSSASELATALSAARLGPLETWQLESLGDFDRSREDWAHPERWAVNV